MNRGHELRGAGCILLPGHAPQQLGLPIGESLVEELHREQANLIVSKQDAWHAPANDPMKVGEAVVFDAVPRGIGEPVIPYLQLGQGPLYDETLRAIGQDISTIRRAASQAWTAAVCWQH